MLDKIKALRNSPKAKIGGVLFFLITLAIIVVSIQKAQQYKSGASGTTGTTQTISGILTVLITDDIKSGKSEVKYFLDGVVNQVKTSTKIIYTGTRILKTGEQLTLSGIKTGPNELTVKDSGIRNTTLTKDMVQLAASGGTATQAVPTGSGRKVAIVMLNWSNYSGSGNPMPTDKAAAESTFNAVESYFENQSNGKLTLSNTQADIFGWTTSNLAYSCTTFGNWTSPLGGGNPIDNYISSLSILPVGVYAQVIIVMPMQAGCDSQAVGALNGTRVRIPSTMWRRSTIEHEMAHNYGVRHSSDHGCPTASGNVDDPSCGTQGVIVHGKWDVMGVSKTDGTDAFGFGPYHKEKFGWNTTSNTRYVTTNSGNINLYPLEGNPGNNVQGIQVCKDAFSFYSVENRNPQGYDTGLPTTATSGVIARLVGPTSASWVLGRYPSTDMLHLNGVNGTVIPVGGTLVDNSNGVRITLNSKTNGIANVSVTYPSGAPTACAAQTAFAAPGGTTTPPPSTPAPTAPAGSSSINVNIGAQDRGNVDVANGGKQSREYSINAGPAKVKSNTSTTDKILSSQRAIYKSSFNSIVGFPTDLLTTEYWYTSYNDVDMIGHLVIGNNSNSTATVDVYIGGVKKTATPFSIAPGQRVFPRYGIISGPVRVVSTNGVPIFTSERSKYKESFNEIWGFPANQLTNEYVFTSYDDVGMATTLDIVNPSSTTASVDVYIGGIKINSTPYSIAPGQRVSPRFGINGGPVKVISTNGVKILASQRAIYKNSFNAIVGFPANQLTTEYWYTTLDDVSMIGHLVIGNNSSANALVDVYIGGVKKTATPFSIAPGQRVFPRYAMVGGPVKVVSTNGVPIFTSERSKYLESFNEIWGFPYGDLHSEYVFTSYDDVGMDTKLEIANP